MCGVDVHDDSRAIAHVGSNLTHQLGSEGIVEKHDARVIGEAKLGSIHFEDGGRDLKAAKVGFSDSAHLRRELDSNQAATESRFVRQDQSLALAAAHVDELPARQPLYGFLEPSFIYALIARAFLAAKQAIKPKAGNRCGFGSMRGVKGVHSVRYITTALAGCLWLFSGMAHAGTCPGGANYLSLANPSANSNAGSVTLASGSATNSAITNCVYSDPVAGSDSTGTGADESHPLKYVKGMPNCSANCASVTTSATTAWIVKGGGVYHVNAGSPIMGSSWTVPAFGYVGVDPTWFTGSSFSRPVINIDNPLSTSLVSSCTYEGTNTTIVSVPSGTVFDNFEIIGMCSTDVGGAGNGGTMISSGGGSIIERVYLHGWTESTSSTDDRLFATGGSGSNRYLFIDINGGDSSLGTVCTATSCPGGVAACWNGSPTTPGTCATGWAMVDCDDVEYSVVKHASQGCEANTIHIWHDNDTEYIFEPAFGTPCCRHGNILEPLLMNSTATAQVYNNVFCHVNDGQNTNLNGTTMYIYNNVWCDDGHFPPDANGLFIEPFSNNSAQLLTAFIYNNTFDSTVGASARAGSTTSSSVVTFANNHIIGRTSPIGNLFTCSNSPNPPCTITDNGGEVFMPTATATTQGYVIGNYFAPTLGTNSTVHAGLNESSSCGSGFTAALCSGIGSVSEGSGFGGLVPVYPRVTVNPRSTTFDAGSYQFNATINFTLTVTVTGSGSVSDSQGGIVACTASGGTCSASYASGTNDTLTETPGGGFTFSTWGGGCSGSSSTCSITLSANTSVTALFLVKPTLTVTVTGVGSVSDSQGGIVNCTASGGTCSATYVNGVSDTLTETASLPYVNGGFSAPCPVTVEQNLPCTLTLTANTSLTANFLHVQLPTTLVNNLEYIAQTSNVILFPNAWICNGATTYPATGNYANSQAGLNQSVADAATCRFNTNTGTTIVIPASTLYSGANGITLPQVAVGSVSDTSTKFIVLVSNHPTPLGVIPCSHGMQDNVLESQQPGVRNVGCSGSNVSYQIGPTLTTVTGAFTLANGTITNTSAYNDVASMYTIQCTASNCNAISTGPADANGVGPHHFAILNAELRPIAGLAGPAAPLQIGTGAETSTTQIPQHIHIAYSFLHGDWTDAPMTGCPSSCTATAGPTGTNNLPNLIALDACIYCSIMYNYMDEALRPGSEGHGISILLAQQLKIKHNWIEGQSIGLLAGGEANQIPISGFIGATDVEDCGNRYTYPFSWMLAGSAGFKANGGTNSYVRKNGHELKQAERYLFCGNIVENVDDTGAQNGTVFSVKVDNNSGSGSVSNNWLKTENVTVVDNIFRGSCNGPSLGYRSNSAGGDGNGVSGPTQLILYQDNLLYWYGVTMPGCSGVSPQFGVRFAQTGTSAVWPTGQVTATRNAAGTIATLTLTSSTNPDLSVSGMNIGDPVNVSGCTGDATFNTGNTNQGPPAISGTLVNGLTVVYASVGPANSTDTTCSFNNGQGWPNYTIINHISDFATNASFANDPTSSSNGSANPYALSRNVIETNSVVVGGGVNSTFAEGTRTQTKAFDALSEIFNNTVLAGRDSAVTCPGHTVAGPGGMAACYTEYTAAYVGITPVTLYGTPTGPCSTTDPTVGPCVGVLGAMNTASFPPYFPDWNQSRLCHVTDGATCNNKASVYSAGQANQATDGTDLGINPTTINSAQTSILYVCKTPCGTPFLDVNAVVPAPYPPAFLGYSIDYVPIAEDTFLSYSMKGNHQ